MDGPLIEAARLCGRIGGRAVGRARELVAYRGSGVSARTVLLAAQAAGLTGGRLCAGSWSEWAGRGLPVALGS